MAQSVVHGQVRIFSDKGTPIHAEMSTLSILLLVVTGCTSGIGREFALQLAKAGFKIVLVSRNEQSLKQLQGELGVSLSLDWRTGDLNCSDAICLCTSQLQLPNHASLLLILQMQLPRLTRISRTLSNR